jgi:hypothetical protein
MIMANSCETCKHYEVEAYDEPCVSCRFRDYDVPTKWENPFKQKTNADRIRAMSDEELARWISDMWHGFVSKPWCDFRCQNCRGGDDYRCEKCALEWLKQPAEGE